MAVQYDLFKDNLRSNKREPNHHWSWVAWDSFYDWNVST